MVSKHYAETVVDPRFEDRWFCSTSEAVANGWLAARVGLNRVTMAVSHKNPIPFRCTSAKH